jgi:hypothetical protein
LGHRRIGFLPKSQKWREIVRQIGDFEIGEASVDAIVRQTTEGVRQTFDDVDTERNLQRAFHFIVAIAVAAREDNPAASLKQIGIQSSLDISPIGLADSFRKWMSPFPTSEEKGIVERAALDSIGEWLQVEAAKTEGGLFGAESRTTFQLLQRASDGAGFCELSRVFFGRFTHGFLTYFLDREASTAIPDPLRRNAFANAIQRHVDMVSRHAFETAKLTQSFAAGWFNKNAADAFPSTPAVRGFVRHALGKLREELRREGES